MDAPTKLEIISTLVAIGGGLIGAVGGTVGIVTAIRSSRREALREIEEQNEFSFLAAFMQTQLQVGERAGQIYTELDIGSPTWQRAEKMVQRGILERGPNGRGYRICGFENLQARPFKTEEKKGFRN